MQTDLADFEIWISAAEVTTPHGPRYPTRVINSPAGPAQSEMSVDLNDAAFQQELALVRSVDPALAEREFVRQAALRVSLRRRGRESLARKRGRSPRDKLPEFAFVSAFEAPELGRLPWELLRDPRDQAFLALTANGVMSRLLPGPEPPGSQHTKACGSCWSSKVHRGCRPSPTPKWRRVRRTAMKNVGPSVTLPTLRNAATAGHPARATAPSPRPALPWDMARDGQTCAHVAGRGTPEPNEDVAFATVVSRTALAAARRAHRVREQSGSGGGLFGRRRPGPDSGRPRRRRGHAIPDRAARDRRPLQRGVLRRAGGRGGWSTSPSTKPGKRSPPDRCSTAGTGARRCFTWGHGRAAF